MLAEKDSQIRERDAQIREQDAHITRIYPRITEVDDSDKLLECQLCKKRLSLARRSDAARLWRAWNMLSRPRAGDGGERPGRTALGNPDTSIMIVGHVETRETWSLEVWWSWMPS